MTVHGVSGGLGKRMKYKAVLYYIAREQGVDFSEERFLPLIRVFSHKVNFIYVDNPESLKSEIMDADFLMSGFEVCKVDLSSAKKLKAFFTYTAGKEHLPERLLQNYPCYFGHFHGILMSESLLGMMTYFNQHIELIKDNAGHNQWHGHSVFSKRRTLRGQSVAIFGYGEIGRHCAKTLISLGMKVYAIQRTYKNGICAVSGAEYIHINEAQVMLSRIDQVVSFLPSAEETNDIFDNQFFKRMKSSAYLYNFGRGNSVVEDDLHHALESGVIAGAALDVFQVEPLPQSSPLWDTKNLIIMPHISAYYENYADCYVEELAVQIGVCLNNLR
jgi:D-2-hydroxyacid dehydrogenase (NADP+)